MKDQKRRMKNVSKNFLLKRLGSVVVKPNSVLVFGTKKGT
jgi:hypothetical protein